MNAPVAGDERLVAWLTECAEPTRRGALADALAVVLGAAPAERLLARGLDVPELDALAVECDRLIGRTLDAILHHPAVQELEALWRGLGYLVAQVPRYGNVRLEVLSVSKEELLDDFGEAPELSHSGLFRLVYGRAYGTFGAIPYGLLCAAFELGPGADDMMLLRRCAAVAAMAHAPFIANASEAFFGVESFAELPRVRELAPFHGGHRFRLWNALRDSEDARYVGLCLPRFLGRLPYRVRDEPFAPLRYDETVKRHDDHLWVPASYAFAARAVDSFVRYRWCVHIPGSQASGLVEGLLRYEFPFMRGLQPRCVVEAQLTTRLEHELSRAGFVGLVYDASTGAALFRSAPSVQRAYRTEAHLELGTQLPYVFLVSRIAHYLKLIQREQLGRWKTSSELERELAGWLRRYVSAMPDPSPEVRARRPLRDARVRVLPVEGALGWLRCHLTLQPHLTHNNAAFTLSLVSRLETTAEVL